MKNLNDVVSENLVNESYEQWTIYDSVDCIGSFDTAFAYTPKTKPMSMKVDRGYDFVCIDMDTKQIYFYSYNDIEMIDKNNGCNGNLVGEVGDLPHGESYYWKQANQTFVALR